MSGEPLNPYAPRYTTPFASFAFSIRPSLGPPFGRLACFHRRKRRSYLSSNLVNPWRVW